jgi:hypothetical protein
MRTATFAFAILGAAITSVAPADLGRAWAGVGPTAAAGTTNSRERATAREPSSLPGRTPARTYPPGTWRSIRTTIEYVPSFVQPLYDSPFAVIPMLRNPLVPSGYKASADYNYLYTVSSAYDAAPSSVASYRYAPDNRFLLRPASGYDATASAYAWSCTPWYEHTITASPLPSPSLDNPFRSTLDRPVVRRKPGQKIDNALKPAEVVSGDQQQVWRPSTALAGLRLGEEFKSPWDGSGAQAASTPAVRRTRQSGAGRCGNGP